jgi:hypothetical protein
MGVLMGVVSGVAGIAASGGHVVIGRRKSGHLAPMWRANPLPATLRLQRPDSRLVLIRQGCRVGASGARGRGAEGGQIAGRGSPRGTDIPAEG